MCVGIRVEAKMYPFAAGWPHPLADQFCTDRKLD